MRNTAFRKLIESLDRIYFGNQFPHLPLDRTEISFIFCLKHLIRLLIKHRSKFFGKVELPLVAIKKGIVILINTENQRNTLMPLANYMGECVTVLDYTTDSQMAKPTNGQLEYLSLKHSFNLLFSYFTMKGNKRSIYRKRFYNLFQIMGMYEFTKMQLSRKSSLPIKLVIVSNDHSGYSLAAILSCKTQNIDSLYIQHACVNSRVSPLFMNYALLDGLDAEYKYKNAGESTTKTFLIGTMKFDKYLNKDEIITQSKYISVCISKYFCDIEKNFELCVSLEARNIPFIIRFHPNVADGMRKKFIERGWSISNKHETAITHILKCNTIISGDSTILLEAIILYRRPLYFASTGVNDFYQYLKTGILDEAYTSVEAVVEGLSMPFDIDTHRAKAEYYNSALNSDYEGKSVERTASIVDDIITCQKNQGKSLITN